MSVQTSQKCEGNGSRRWSLLAGGGLLTLGIALAGFSLPSTLVTAAQAPDKKDAKKTEPTKPTETDDDDAVRKAIEDLKKGPAPREKDKDESNPVRPDPRLPVNPRLNDPFAEAQRQQLEMMKRLMEQMQKQGGGQPGNVDDVARMFEEMMKQMQGQNRFQFPEFPAVGGRVGGGRIGIDRLTRLGGEGRMGIRIEKPSTVLIDQLDLPKTQGMVVSEVRTESVADKAGIKVNDILLEIDGKAIPSELQDFARMISEIKAETPINVTLLRKGRKETIKGLKLPELPQQRPALPRFPGIGFQPLFPVPGGIEGGGSISITRNNDDFVVVFSENNLKMKLVGAVTDGKAKVTSIEINDNGTNINAESPDKLDPKYQKMIEKITSGIR